MADGWKKQLKTRLFQPLEAVPVALLYGLFWALPVDVSAAIGAGIARTLGPRLGASNRIRRNLELALPDLDRTRQDEVIREVWDNLGRLVGEFPHVPTLQKDPSRIEIVGLEHAEAVTAQGGPAIFFTAHFGNWELGDVVAQRLDRPWSVVYRRADNPWVEKLYNHARRGVAGGMIPKGPQGARELTKRLRGGAHVAMLLDQKMNDGIAVPFFGKEAMTAPAAAQFALKYQCPLVPVRTERLSGSRFRVTVEPPLDVVPGGDREADVQRIMTRINDVMEGWIRNRPGQWFWLHRRWPKELYRS